ncbi:hypothetical protein QYE76_016280 [Lolium multiflorum]|uniref:Reverse transcriptase RNase H-like domain-containing protein n=1 Tax=Lolium multiflorum TaxID=4521 RepID=A0AAD8U8M2_LOLMU|nr:hypothetical protein QYE76_016280 [Lolium multiflorum]
MKLNPAKCTFGVPAGQLLGYLVSGEESKPTRRSVPSRRWSCRCLKDVQKFTGCLASLSRFVSRLVEKALPLYQLMKKADKFVWSPQADEAFRDLKRVLSTAPILATPANYPHYQKVTYGVYMAAKKLKHYFQEHPIRVVATAPLAEIIGSKDANGRVAKWALELAAHTILYEPRTAIKSHPRGLLRRRAEMQYLPLCRLHAGSTSTARRCEAAWEPASSSLPPREIGWTMSCRSTSPHPTMWRSMKRSSMG